MGLVHLLVLMAACGTDSGPGTGVTRATSDGASSAAGTAATVPPVAGSTSPRDDAAPRLDDVETWFYLLDVDLEDAMITDIGLSSYDMVVIDFIVSEANNTDYPIQEVVARLRSEGRPRIVLAYVDIGQAEDFRAYWQPQWRPGDPEWIVGLDPDGWEGNYPVAFWYDEWRSVWLDDGGLIEQIVQAGFDGVYLDWVEAYSDESVVAAADADGLDPRQEMIWWVGDIAERGRGLDPGFLVVAQNAAELVSDDSYADVIDGLAQEQVWFDGAADNDPPGDCPLPRTDADVDSEEYVASLSPGCLAQYEEFPESTLHVSSEEYLRDLEVALQAGVPVFTVDYALDPANVAWVLETARSHGFVPFVGSRALDGFVAPYE
jgi:cysteinyl-tRNA synthetase